MKHRAQQLENQLDELLHGWQLRAGVTIGIDQRQRVLARLRQLQRQQPERELDTAAIIGPLLCQSPQALEDFRLYCAKPQSELPGAPVSGEQQQPPIAPDSSKTLVHLRRVIRRWQWALLLTGVLFVTVFAGWSEWRQMLCRLPLWASYHCEEPPSAELPQDTTSTALTQPEPRDHSAYNEPIIEPVVAAPRQPALRFEIADLPQLNAAWANPLWLLVLPLIGGALGALSVALMRRALEQTLSRAPTTRQMLDLIDLAQLSPVFVSAANRLDIARLQYRHEHSPRLDVRRSVAASARHGMPQLVAAERQRKRHFLIAVPVTHLRDWRGAYYATLVQELIAAGLPATLCQYQRNPESLAPYHQPQNTAPIGQWQRQHSNSTLVMFVDPSVLFHSVFGNPLGWLSQVHSWRDHLLICNESLQAEQQQQLQAAGYHLRQAGIADNLQILLRQLYPGQSADESDPSSVANPRIAPIDLPVALQAFGASVIDLEPDASQLNELLHWLRYRLSADSFRLLCASVIFPRPDWRLTRALAHRLADEPGWHARDALSGGSPQLLAPLVLLPWSRHGFFPLWLRRALAAQLSAAEELQVAGLLRDFLHRATQGQLVQPLTLAVDTPTTGLARWLGWLRKDNPLQDVLFSSVIRRNRLALLLPKWANQQLRYWHRARGATAQMIWRAGMGAALASGMGWLIWQQLSVPAQLEQRVAERCRINAGQPIVIEYLQPLAAQAQALSANLAPLCYQPTLQPLPDDAATENTNTLLAPEADVQLLARAIRYALYESPLEARVSTATQAVIGLHQPLRSGQVFRQRWLDSALPSVPDALLPVLDADTIVEHSGLSKTQREENLTSPEDSATFTEPDMVTIPTGEFMMGSENGSDDERPVHRVTIAAFEMARHELTWGEWQQCEVAGVCPVLERPDWINELDSDDSARHPVVNVSWDQAQVYIDWINTVTGGGYRLPSEAEFEYALRAGSEAEYPWEQAEQCDYSNGLDQAYQRENPDLYSRFADCDDGYINTAPVGSFRVNAFDLYDTAGNAREWTQDCWNDSYVGAPGDGSAWETGECDRPVLRGGGWLNAPGSLRSAGRSRFLRGFDKLSLVGFRLARTP